MSFLDVLTLQTLLDRQNFSCGVLDGKFGPKTRTALRAWQEQRGLPPTGEPDAASMAALRTTSNALTTHVVGPGELAALTPVPKTWLGKSKVPRLGYETVLETVAEEYHASQQALRDLNPDLPWPDPPAGTPVVVPDPRPFKTPPAARLTISLGRKVLTVYGEDGRMQALFPCSIAADKAKRPVGEVAIVNCAADPTFTFDPAVFTEDPEAREPGRRLLIPPGPNNPVGVAWISLSLSGYGIHGTPRPEDIGKTGSHGCFRLANWNAEKLLKMIRIGLPVRIEE